MTQPIDHIEWISTDDIKVNDYNPNVVLDKELELLKFSLLKQGWIQPILVNKQDMEIIDGFHRFSLCKFDEEVRAMTDGKVPVVFFDMTTSQRMCLTIRINRAKWVHQSLLMSNVVHKLFNDFKMSVSDISTEIGATKEEVNLLLQDNVFTKKDIKNHTYSKAWTVGSK